MEHFDQRAITAETQVFLVTGVSCGDVFRLVLSLRPEVNFLRAHRARPADPVATPSREKQSAVNPDHWNHIAVRP